MHARLPQRWNDGWGRVSAEMQRAQPGVRKKSDGEMRYVFAREICYSAASAYSVTGGHEHTRLRSP